MAKYWTTTQNKISLSVAHECSMDLFTITDFQVLLFPNISPILYLVYYFLQIEYEIYSVLVPFISKNVQEAVRLTSVHFSTIHFPL